MTEDPKWKTQTDGKIPVMGNSYLECSFVYGEEHA
jgi:hypothetical protein